jgi:hypothetical protein
MYFKELILWAVLQSSVTNAALPADSLAQRVVVRVGQLEVPAAELAWHMQSLRTACYSYFTGRYGVYNGSDFWQHSFSGDTPVVWLRGKALQQMIADKQKLLLMQSYGVLKEYDFTRFLAQWQQENQRRAQQVAAGQVVYGNIAFDVYSYYAYVNTNAWLNTQRQLLAQQKIAVAAFKTWYEQIKEQQFKKQPTVVVTLLTKHAVTRKLSSRSIRFEPESRKGDELQWGEVFTRSIALNKTGARSQWFTDEAGNACQLTCSGYIAHGYISFEAALENVKTAYAAHLLVQQLTVQEKQTPVWVDTAVVNSLYPG